MGETLHEKGRQYVMELKKFLESTGNFYRLVTSYNENDITVLPKIDGKGKRFDLAGIYEDPESVSPIEVYIEAKDYSKERDLEQKYHNFLQDCFSIWISMRKISHNKKAKFLFIVSHPFGCKNYIRHKSYNLLKDLVDSHQVLNSEFESLDIEDLIFKFLSHVDIIILSESRRLIRVYKKKLLQDFIH